MSWFAITIGTLNTRALNGPGDLLADGEAAVELPDSYDPMTAEADYVALTDPPYIRLKTESERKAEAAAIKTEEIYREQELRSRTVMGSTPIPRDIFAFIEEFYSKILLPAARNNITEANTPKTWGLKQLRDNRDTLLTGLQAWVNDPAKTADDILAFDVAGWSGWTIARPE